MPEVMTLVHPSCQGEKCTLCKSPAARKVGEEMLSPPQGWIGHNLTAYVCLDCFRWIMSGVRPARFTDTHISEGTQPCPK